MEKLNIDSINIFGEELVKLNKLNLKKLSVKGSTFVTMENLICLNKSIENLNLSYMENNIDIDLLFKHFPNLIKLNLECSKLTPSNVNGCIKCEKLNLSGCNINITTEFRHLRKLNLNNAIFENDFFLDLLKNNPNIESLNIGNTTINDNDLKNINICCKKLQYINLSYCKNITNNGMKYLNCEKINISDSNIDDLGIYYLCKPSLRKLHLNSLNITDKALEYLYKLDNLCCLRLYFCNKLSMDFMIKFSRKCHIVPKPGTFKSELPSCIIS